MPQRPASYVPPPPPSRAGGALLLLMLFAVVATCSFTVGYSIGKAQASPYPVLVADPSCSAAGAPHVPVPPPSASVAPPEPPPAALRPEDIVRSAVGRWRSRDGRTVIEVDPPKPLPGRAPPYRLVVRGPGLLPKSGFGCEFAQGDERHGPGDVVYFRAWCGKGERATLGLGLSGGADPTLIVVVLQEGELLLRTDGQRVPASP